MKYLDIQSKYNLVDEQGLTYTVEVPAADKIIGRCDSDREKAILVAKRPEKNEKVIAEWDRLKWLKDENVPVVPLLSEVFYVDYRENPLKTCAAFCVKWIDGPHSKTNKQSFGRALAGNKENPILREDFQKLREYITKVAGVRDLQLMFESATSHLYIIDPEEIFFEPRPDDTLIKLCDDLLSGNVEPSDLDDYIKSD